MQSSPTPLWWTKSFHKEESFTRDLKGTRSRRRIHHLMLDWEQTAACCASAGSSRWERFSYIKLKFFSRPPCENIQDCLPCCGWGWRVPTHLGEAARQQTCRKRCIQRPVQNTTTNMFTLHEAKLGPDTVKRKFCSCQHLQSDFPAIRCKFCAGLQDCGTTVGVTPLPGLLPKGLNMTPRLSEDIYLLEKLRGETIMMVFLSILSGTQTTYTLQCSWSLQGRVQ